MKLKNYFNKKSFGAFGAGGKTVMGLGFGASAVLSCPTIPLAIVAGLVMSAFTAGHMNKWQEEAAGKPFWKPKLNVWGL